MEDKIDPRELEIGASMPLKIEFGKGEWDTALRLNGEVIDECYGFCLTGKADADNEPVLLSIDQWRFEDRSDGLGTDVYKDKVIFEIEGGELTTKATLKKIIRGKKKC